ncbi:MAG: creatininase family protein [Pseudomonadota bacterium]|nr:creatininase family protein [Pseudomonadota bacterium]
MTGRLDVIPGQSILAETIAEMTLPEVEAAIGRGAIALWGLGVVEQHGPHLPTGTDIYIPSARLRLTRQELAARGLEALIVPPFYWGVNHVSSGFGASYQVRPSAMVDLMCDVIASLGRDGFRHLFCISGHGDALHNRTIHKGCVAGSVEDGIRARFVAGGNLLDRLGIARDDPHALATGPEFPAARPGARHVDVHAGDWETSLMLAIHPEVVRRDALPDLPDTALGPDDLAVWRQGGAHARGVTPNGYFGDPASATVEFGRQEICAEARDISDAIYNYLKTRQ